MDRDFNERSIPNYGKQENLKKSLDTSVSLYNTDSSRIRFTLSPENSNRNSLFNVYDTPNSSRTKIDVNKTFQLISKHLIPSPLLRSNCSKSDKHEVKNSIRKSLDPDTKYVNKDRGLPSCLPSFPIYRSSRESESKSVCTDSPHKSPSNENYKVSSYVSLLKSKCGVKNEVKKKFPTFDDNIEEFSKKKRKKKELSSSDLSLFEPKTNSTNDRKPHVDSGNSSKKRKRESDEEGNEDLSNNRYSFKRYKYSRVKKMKSPSPTFNLLGRFDQSHRKNKSFEIDYSSNSDTINSSTNSLSSSLRNVQYEDVKFPKNKSLFVKQENKLVSHIKHGISLYEDSDKLFSRRKLSCKSNNNENSVASSSLRGSWEISPIDDVKNSKRKVSTGSYSSNSSPWQLTYDKFSNKASLSSSFSSKERRKRVLLSNLDGWLSDSVAKKIKRDSNVSNLENSKSLTSNKSVFNNPNFENENSSFLDLSSSKRSSSSFVIYDECSSEEEMGWNGKYGEKNSFLSPANYLQSDISFTKTSDSEYSSKSEVDDTLTPSLVKENQVKKRIMDKIERMKRYIFPADLDTISSEIDLRLLGRHDDWIYSEKRKIFILGDSHTRFLVNGMKQILPGFKIYTFCKPSATTEQVFSGLDMSISELTERDFLILFCGTNDMWSDSTHQAEKCMAERLECIKNTNILVCNVPVNYSESSSSYVQKNIGKFNKFLKKTIKKFSNIFMVNLHKVKRSIFFTKHGLHFNGMGKVKICEILSHKVVDVLDKLNPSRTPLWCPMYL